MLDAELDFSCSLQAGLLEGFESMLLANYALVDNVKVIPSACWNLFSPYAYFAMLPDWGPCTQFFAIKFSHDEVP